MLTPKQSADLSIRRLFAEVGWYAAHRRLSLEQTLAEVENIWSKGLEPVKEKKE